jgi:23S rRNA pseudouridine2604 synthase
MGKIMEEIRLNKYLSDAGVCSRREADRAVEAGLVQINGKPAQMGQKVTDRDVILFQGKKVRREEPFILLAVNKPRGIVCTTAEEEKDNIVDFLHYPKRIYPIGRLDKDSEGLILMTNRGDLVNRILRGGNGHEKEYLVRVNGPVTEGFLQRMSSGVAILDTVTKPCRVEKTGRNSFRIVLTQGLNRQIRRMCEALGYRVVYLKRVRVMNIRLGDLKSGAYRKIEGAELAEMMKQLEGSSSRPFWEKTEKENGRREEQHG